MNVSVKQNSIVFGPVSLSDRIRNKLNVVRRYHSGRISNGVANGVPDSIFPMLCNIVKLVVIDKCVPIASGKMYKISFGHAGSPYKLCPQPLDNLSHNIEFFKSANFTTTII